MAALDIRPHSHRVTGLAVAGLTLVAAGSFALGVARQMATVEPQAAPANPPAVARASLISGPPEATPARDLQVAAAIPRAPAELPPSEPDAPVAADSAAEPAPTAADASANAADIPTTATAPPPAAEPSAPPAAPTATPPPEPDTPPT